MEKELQVGVKIILQNEEGEYLFLFRSLASSTKSGPCWDIPGGRINTGSSLLENLEREVAEETGLEIESVTKLLTAQDIFKKDKEVHVVRLTYLGKTNGQVILSEEHTEYKWITLDQLSEIQPLDSYIKEVFEKFLN